MRMKNRQIYIVVSALCLVTMLGSCRKERQFFPKNIQPEQVNILRFDSALLSLPTDSATMLQEIGSLYEQFPVMTPVFAEDIVGIDRDDTASLCGALSHFLTDTLFGFAQTNKREQELFSDISDIRQQLGKSFGRLRIIYPDYTIPDIYFIVSGFNAGLFLMDGDAVVVVVGADMYLGSDYPYYNRVVYEYQKKTMRRECIAGDVISAVLYNIIPYTSKQNRLLDNMIYRGKIMYLASHLLQEESKWQVMGYSQEEWQWCERNETAIWRLMLDKQDLFKTETIVLTSYLNDGPFTSEISQESPARLGTWIGWRIVEQYMQHNKDVSLAELMAEGDAQKVLEKSGYRP